MSGVSRAAPSMTTPATFLWMAEWVASSPQMAGADAAGVDDDDVARLGLVDGLHRLGPVARVGAHGDAPARPSWRPGQAGQHAGQVAACGAGRRRRWRSRPGAAARAGRRPVARTKYSDSTGTRSAMACLICRVASVASVALVIGAADDDDGGAGLAPPAAAVSELMPPATATGIETAAATCAQRVEGGLALHLLVDGHVDADVARAHRLHRLGPGDRVGHLDHVHDDLGAVVAAGLDALADGGVGGGAQHAHDVGARLGGVLHLGAAGVHGLHVGDDGLVGAAPCAARGRPAGPRS